MVRLLDINVLIVSLTPVMSTTISRTTGLVT